MKICTHQENMMNMRKRRDNTSGKTNVYWHKRERKWEVIRQYKGKTYYGGAFVKKSDAINALKLLKIELGI